MSYEDVINIINAHYGWSMDAHEPEYKGEIREKMQAMKQLVRELQAKSEAFDEVLKSYNEALSEGHMADDVCNIVEKYLSGERNVEER